MEMSPFGVTVLSGKKVGGGEVYWGIKGYEPKADPKLVTRSRGLGNNYLEGFFPPCPKFC